MIRPSTVGPHPTRGAPGSGRRGGVRRPHRRVHPGHDGVANLVQPGPRQLLQRGHVLHAELRDHPPGQFPGLLAARGIAAAARLRRRAVNQSLRRRHPEQRRHLGAAARLAVDHHAVRVAPEVRDVVPDPLERRHQVGHPDVHRVGIRRPAELGEVEEPEDVEAVIDGHRHDVVVPRHLRPVLGGELVRRAEREAAAVDVEHHGTLAGQAGRPDVHLEHVLALPPVGPLLEERLLARPVVQTLRAVGPVGQRRILAIPRLGRFGRKPAVLSAGVRTVRHALEREDPVLHVAAHLPVSRVRHGRPGRAAAPRGRPWARPAGWRPASAMRGPGQRDTQARGGRQVQQLTTTQRRVRHSASPFFIVHSALCILHCAASVIAARTPPSCRPCRDSPSPSWSCLPPRPRSRSRPGRRGWRRSPSPRSCRRRWSTTS